jgi:hypothetical protein
MPKSKPKKVWIIWYEDIEGLGDKHVFKTEVSAKERIAELLGGIMDSVDGEWKAAEEQGHMDDFHEELKRLSEAVRSALSAGKVQDALDLWQEFESEDQQGTRDWFGTLRVEGSVIAG